MNYNVDPGQHLTSVVRPSQSMHYPSFLQNTHMTFAPSYPHFYHICKPQSLPNISVGWITSQKRFPARLNIVIKLYFGMWHAYQYGQGRLKLVKDLKTGQAHLRVSLIDKEEINDLGRIYKQRKNYYKIDQQSMTAPPVVEEEPEEEGTAHLSYKEKVDLYRRRMQSQKIEDKYNNLFKKTEKRRFQMRNPILFKLLQNFEENHKHEDHLKVAEDLKESDKNLEMIKINTNRRAKFQESFLDDPTLERPKFLSLQSGLPEKQRKPFPKWKDYAQGKFIKPDRSNDMINLANLQANMDTLMGFNPIRSKKHSQSAVNHSHSMHREMSSPFHRDKSSPSARTTMHNEVSTRVQEEKKGESRPCDFCDRCKKEKEKQTEVKVEDPGMIVNRTYKSRSAVAGKRAITKNKTVDNINTNASRTFTKSQNYSRDVIETMSGFYNSKASKKTQYKKMILYLKNDRPLTSQIRRKNYKMIGETQLKDVKQYRNYSEQQRLRIRDQNYEFYLRLLKKMETHTVQELPLSGKIIQKTRTILQSNYLLTQHHFQMIAQPALYEQRDPLSQILLEQIERLINHRSQ